MKHDTLYFSDQTQQEIWYRERFRLVLSHGGKRAAVVDPVGDEVTGTDVGLVYSGGLPGVDWISADDYQAPVRKNSVLCYFFQRKRGDTMVGQAWIDVHTGLPVEVQIGLMKYDFRFRSPPGSLTLPSPYAEAWQRYEQLETRRRLEALPPPH